MPVVIPVPTFEPAEIVIGETLQWTKYVQDYAPGDWTLTYYFRGPGPGFDIVAGADGSIYTLDFETSSVVGLIPGTYAWQAWVENEDEEKHFVDHGTVTVKVGLVGTLPATTVEARSETKIALDNLRAMLGSGPVSKGVQSYSIGNRQLSRYSVTELIELEKRFTELYAAEVRKEQATQGAPFMRNVYTRFTNPG